MNAAEAFEFVDRLRKKRAGTDSMRVAGNFVQVEQAAGVMPPGLIMAHAVLLSAHGRAFHKAVTEDTSELRKRLTEHDRTEITEAIEIIEASLVMIKEAVGP